MLHRLSLSSKTPPTRINIEDSGRLGFDYQIRLSRRKTMAMEVRDGQVLVAAPHRTNLKQLHRWVETKANWVRQKLEEQALRRQQVPTPQFCDGARWAFLGKKFIVNISHGNRKDCTFEDGSLNLCLSSRSRRTQTEQIRLQMQDWYKQVARDTLTQKSIHVCQRLNTQFRSINLRRTKTKWGHCTARGELQYNWLIMQAPEDIVDYLVAHECCHLLHLNHGPNFWAQVKDICPDYLEQRQWLKDNGHRLVF